MTSSNDADTTQWPCVTSISQTAHYTCQQKFRWCDTICRASALSIRSAREYPFAEIPEIQLDFVRLVCSRLNIVAIVRAPHQYSSISAIQKLTKCTIRIKSFTIRIIVNKIYHHSPLVAHAAVNPYSRLFVAVMLVTILSTATERERDNRIKCTEGKSEDEKSPYRMLNTDIWTQTNFNKFLFRGTDLFCIRQVRHSLHVSLHH